MVLAAAAGIPKAGEYVVAWLALLTHGQSLHE
jgi:hypothetical protein